MSEVLTMSQSVAPLMRGRTTAAQRRRREQLIAIALGSCAALCVATTLGIVFILLKESFAFFQRVPLQEFLFGKEWTPLFDNPKFGIGVLLAGTLSTSLVALAIAVPLGTVIAIYLSEFASERTREVCKPVLELLAGVPTVVFGFFALLLVTPLLQKLMPGLPGFNVLSAGLVMGIMIIPTVASLSEDAMRSVPMSLREGSFATGASRLTTALRVVFPAALSGIAATYVLAVSRAVGETMIVAVAAGMQPNLSLNPLEPAATVTSFIVQVTLGDLPHGSIGFQTIFAAGLVLFLLTLLFNLLGHWIRHRFREAY